jgi:hypothetical protein
MLRLNHPETFDGAIASATPLHLTAVLFPDNSEQYVMAEWVGIIIFVAAPSTGADKASFISRLTMLFKICPSLSQRRLTIHGVC